ncbi:MAG: hypothetical protein LUQ61_08430 [Methanoregulaceae archaeon]|nr:hypothetical protein [Methanoregulaceae archaeon]
MADRRWTLYLAVALVALSAALYLLHFALFQDPYHIWLYLLGDLAFLPIEVLLVTIILHRLLELRDRQTRLEKLNMVIGTFFSTIGTELLTLFSDHDPRMPEFRKRMVISEKWSPEDFARLQGELTRYACDITITEIDLPALRSFLGKNEDFMIRLLENPFLLEHESFTELLQAIFHLTDELKHRNDLIALPESDLRHLSGDVCRAYQLLIRQWLQYVLYLKENYPYLFSLALRTNPFDEKASVIVS